MSSSVTKIPCTKDTFFNYWLQFISPLHKLQKKEIEILALILKKRYDLSQVIMDDTIIDSYLFTKETRDEIIEEANETRANFQVILSKLRKQGVILQDNKINKRFIPNLPKGGNRFDLMIIFDIQGNDIK